jgi:hypothetical protein
LSVVSYPFSEGGMPRDKAGFSSSLIAENCLQYAVVRSQ